MKNYYILYPLQQLKNSAPNDSLDLCIYKVYININKI